MKAILEFSLPDDKEDFETATKALDFKLALWDISQEIFRPNRKHGYPNQELQTLREKEEVVKAIDILEEKFYDILREYNIEL